jgi:hypothetical protein
MIVLLFQPTTTTTTVEAAKSLIDYGVVGAILILALAGIAFMYITNNKREKERHDSFRVDMQAVAVSNREERERWQTVDTQRFEAITELTKLHTEASIKTAVALEQLGMIIKERIK